jgi:hypothetical protein
MTIRVRTGGVYDWDVPGPNEGSDSKAQRRIRPIGGAVTMDSRWDSRGRRAVRMSHGGHAVGWVYKNRTWRLKDRPVKGSAKTVDGCLRALQAAL